MSKETSHLLRTKCIHQPISPKDGYRISIMSRHTLNDGVTPDPLISDKVFDEWMKELAPQDTLIGAYYKRGLSWEEFENKYLEFLTYPDQLNKINSLLELTHKMTVTLLCVEETPQHCHRRLLAEQCKKLHPDISVLIK